MKIRIEKTIACAMTIAIVSLINLGEIQFAAGCQRPSPGDRPSEGTGQQQTNKPGNVQAVSQDPQDKKATANEKPTTKVLAITGGDIYTITQGIIRNGTILIRDGKIAEIGQRIDIPAGAETIDATGKTIAPGFVAISMAGVGIRSAGGGFGGPGGRGRESGSNDEIGDTLDPFDRNVKLALAVGITSGCAQVGGGGGGRRGRREPERPFIGLDPDEAEVASYDSPAEADYGDELPTCPCCGLTYLPLEPIDETPQPRPQQLKFVAMKMSYGSLDGMLVKEAVFYAAPSDGLNSAEAVHNWRKQFEQARKYMKELAEHEAAIKAGERKQPPRNPVSEEFLKLVKKEVPLRVAAESVGQIRAMLALAKELDYQIVIERATEGWVIPNEISEAGASVIVSPRMQRQPRFGEENTTGSFIEMPRVLARAGVPFAVMAISNSISLGGIAGRDLSALPLEAAFAVRGGATEAQALEAITIVPARMMGLGDRIGSLEVGKDADILILDGSPLSYRTWVETAIVNGRQVYNRAADKIMPQ